MYHHILSTLVHRTKHALREWEIIRGQIWIYATQKVATLRYATQFSDIRNLLPQFLPPLKFVIFNTFRPFSFLLLFSIYPLVNYLFCPYFPSDSIVEHNTRWLRWLIQAQHNRGIWTRPGRPPRLLPLRQAPGGARWAAMLPLSGSPWAGSSACSSTSARRQTSGRAPCWLHPCARSPIGSAHPGCCWRSSPSPCGSRPRSPSCPLPTSSRSSSSSQPNASSSCATLCATTAGPGLAPTRNCCVPPMSSVHASAMSPSRSEGIR